MKVTQNLKAWAVKAKALAETATDDEVKAAALAALGDGSLSAGELAELTKTVETTAAGQLTETLAALAAGQKAVLERLEKLETVPAGAGLVAPGAPALKSSEGEEQPTGTKRPVSLFEKRFADSFEDDDVPVIRVKGVEERYAKERKSLSYPAKTAGGRPHPMAGQPMMEGEGGNARALYEPSDLEKAANGAYVKFVIQSQLRSKTPRPFRMTEHDQQLVQYALRELSWGGVIGGEGSEDEGAIAVKNRRLTDLEIKAILDDSSSGGVEIAPIAFDDMIISTPLLNGEIYPRVNVVPITRGRRIEGGSIGNVTLTSGGADGTAIPLFNTSSFIAAFDTNIFVVNGALEIGLDFLSDSPIDVATLVSAQYGQQLLTWLDTQIVGGDGTTEPEGILVASGTVTVNAANGSGGPWTVGDYESLLFGVAKQYKTGFATNRIAYAANETTYSRARGIAVGASDQRRVFGMSHEDYQIFGHPYAISEAFTNRQVIFANFARYRMYRRLGLTLRVTTEGQTLVRNNLMMISARARFGGQLEDGNAAAVCTDGKS